MINNRIRNNVIAFGIVVCFWIALVFPAMVQAADPIVTDATTKVTTTTDAVTTVRTNPPSAISPSMSTSNSDLCIVPISAAVQTQLFGLSFGSTQNFSTTCQRLKLSKLLFDLGMKVSSVAILCQDERVFRAMASSGTYCPASGGLIGLEAKKFWDDNPKLVPKAEPKKLNREGWIEKGINSLVAILLVGLIAK